MANVDAARRRARARKVSPEGTSTRPRLAVIDTIYPHNKRDIAKTLRTVCDGIVAGEYGEVQEYALVMWSGDQGLSVFGAGANHDAGSAHLLLTAGANKLVGMLIRHSLPNSHFTPPPKGAA